MKKILVLVVCLLSASSGFADFVKHTGTILPMDAEDFTQSFEAPLFNSSLGTLDSILIEFVVSTSGTISATNNGSGYDTFSIDLWQLTHIVLPDSSYGSVISDPPTNYGTYGVAPDETVVYTVDPFYGNFSTTVTQEYYRDLLTGTGNGTFWFDGSISYSWIATYGSPYTIDLGLNTGMDWTIQYNYTVPEPMTLVMLAGLSLFVRRKIA